MQPSRPLCPVTLAGFVAGAAVLLLGAAGPSSGAPAAAGGKGSPEVVAAYRDQHGARILADFAEFLRLPNRAQDAADIERAGAWARDALRDLGIPAELLQVEDAPPIVYGRLKVPDATRTLGIYVHYDGQPVDPRNWTHPPFEPTLYSASMEQGGEPIPFPAAGDRIDPQWRIYARSAGDDKAPIAALLPVLRALGAEGIAPTSNLVFLFDGEEEAGSPHLGEYLTRFRRHFEDVDIWLFFDGPVHQSGRPQLTFGVRGAMGMEVTVYGATRNLHSGHYGNWAPDTPAVLARLLASMKDEQGRVLIEGWYDTVEPIGPQEQAALREMPDYDAELRRELGISRTEGAPATLAERLLLPALTIRGLSSGNTGALARNVIPNQAVASLGIRLVKGNDPQNMGELIVRHIEREGFHVVTEDPDLATRLKYPRIAKVTGGRDGSPAARTSMSNPYAQQIIVAAQDAAERAFGDDALILSPGMGGTLPLYLFTEVAGKPAVVVPVANHDNNQHAPDENLRVGNLWYAMDLYAALLTMPAPQAMVSAVADGVVTDPGRSSPPAVRGARPSASASLPPAAAPLPVAPVAPVASRDRTDRTVRFHAEGRVLPSGLPFSEAVEVDGMLILSGQIGVIPGTLELVPGGMRAEAQRTLENVELLLNAYGYGREDVVKCLVMLADIGEWEAFNEIYQAFFSAPFPARSALGASGLALGARVELECLAVR